MTKIKLLDREFETFISQADIALAVRQVANQINSDFEGKEVIFLSILNGAFMFTSDLLKLVTVSCQLSFVKLASYVGTQSGEKMKQLIGFNEDLSGKTVIVIEDIVDTGRTIEYIMAHLAPLNPAQVHIATLILKPEVYNGPFEIKYVGLKIPQGFIVGYGLDYDGYGRNLADIYKVTS